jgi:integrase
VFDWAVKVGLCEIWRALQHGAFVHPKVMSERLGHSSITITLDLYSHAIPALGADAADRIAAVVDGF